MTALEALIVRHQLLAFYILTFAVSWLGLLVVIGGPNAIPVAPDDARRLMPAAALALIVGPSIAAVLISAIESGFAGLRDIASRLLRWRVDLRWYLAAIAIAPATMFLVLLPLSRFSSSFVPPIVTSDDRASLLMLGAGSIAFGGLLEEIGWTGFVIPRLLRRHSVLTTGLIVGMLWGAWHFPVNWWFSGAIAGSMRAPAFVPLYFATGVAQLTAYRMLMVWIYDRTSSVLVATLMHGSLIASTAMPILVPAVTGPAFLAWFAASAAVQWVIVAVVMPIAGRANHEPRGSARTERTQNVAPRT